MNNEIDVTVLEYGAVNVGTGADEKMLARSAKEMGGETVGIRWVRVHHHANVPERVL